MLICKNCFTENAADAIKCHECKMEGNFMYKAPEGNVNEVKLVEMTPPSCTNCGHEAPGEGEKCNHCHFPIAKENKRNDTFFIPRISETLRQAQSS